MASTKQTLDELLSDFSQRLDDLYENNDEVFQSMVMSEFVQSLDSVALGKPEPLAKNKQFEQVCACIPSPPFINEDNLNIPYCRWCGEDFKQT